MNHYVDFGLRVLVVGIASAFVIAATGGALFAGIWANGGATTAEPFSLTATIIVGVIWFAVIFATYRLAQASMQWLDRN